MIIVQTPLRISFFGGGTDFPGFYEQEGGCVLSSAIDKYIFVSIKKRFDDRLRIGYTRTENVETVQEVQHELIRQALIRTGIVNGVEIATTGDIPAGSGLGSSSTVTVGALHAMHAYKNELVTAQHLAEQAVAIEIGDLGKPIGVQDQFIAAYGGLRLFEFHKSGQITQTPVNLDPDLKRRLNESLMLFFTGVTRKADDILAEQKTNITDRISVLKSMRDMAHTAYDELQKGNLDCLGNLLHEGWQLKKLLASQISNGSIDEWYDQARKAGALGGKITGAGGGGFLMLYCPPERRDAVREALSELRELPFQLEPDGSKVIFNYRR